MFFSSSRRKFSEVSPVLDAGESATHFTASAGGCSAGFKQADLILKKGCETVFTKTHMLHGAGIFTNICPNKTT